MSKTKSKKQRKRVQSPGAALSNAIHFALRGEALNYLKKKNPRLVKRLRVKAREKVMKVRNATKKVARTTQAVASKEAA